MCKQGRRDPGIHVCRGRAGFGNTQRRGLREAEKQRDTETERDTEIHTRTHRGGETGETERHRGTERQGDREAERQRDRETE